MQPNRRGRPRIDPSGRPVASVQVKLPAADYDAVRKVADARRESVQDAVRRVVRKEFSHFKLTT